MAACNAERTLLKTWQEVVSHDIVDLVIVVDNASRDRTVAVARELEKMVVHGGMPLWCYVANRGLTLAGIPRFPHPPT